MSGREERQLTDSTDDSQITDDSLEEPGKLRTLSPHLVSGELESLLQWSIHHWSSSSEAPCFAPACTQRTPLVSQRQQYNANSSNKYYPVDKQGVTLCLVSAAFFSALGSSFLYGYNLSVVNAAAPFVMEFCNRTWEERYGEAIGEETSTFIWSITVAIFCIGGACGAILSTVLVKYFGRKGTLLLNNSFALTGCLMMSLGEKADSFEMLIIGRIIIGVNSGISLNSVSMYLAEISPVHIRGSICQLNAILVNSGILVGQVLGLPQLFGQESRWNFLFAFIALPSVLQLCVLPHLPESPRYLLIEKNDEVGAQIAFRRLLGKQDVSKEMEEVWAECRAQSNTRAISALSLVRNPAVRWQIITVLITMACYQLCGFNALFYYTDGILDEAGIEDDIIPYITLSLGGTEVVVSIFTGLAIERYGRRRLFVLGYVGMAVSLSLLTLFLNIQHRAPWIPYLSFGSILLVIAAFCLGPAGASYILTGELFEQSYRPAAFMIGGTVSWICNFTVGQVFPFIEEVFQTYVFMVFVGVCSACAIYIYIVLPETKNKTFREVSRSFAARNKVSIPEIQKDYIPIYRHDI